MDHPENVTGSPGNVKSADVIRRSRHDPVLSFYISSCVTYVVFCLDDSGCLAMSFLRCSVQDW